MRERRLSDLERFLKKQDLLEVEPRSKIEKSYQNLMLSIKMFSPIREYEKVNELERLRKARKQIKIEEENKSPFD